MDEALGNDMHQKQEEILNSLNIKDYEKDVIYGQYETYRDEPNVDPKSKNGNLRRTTCRSPTSPLGKCPDFYSNR